MEVLQKGDKMYHAAVLDILKALFEVSAFCYLSPTRPLSHTHESRAAQQRKSLARVFNVAQKLCINVAGSRLGPAFCDALQERSQQGALSASRQPFGRPAQPAGASGMALQMSSPQMLNAEPET